MTTPARLRLFYALYYGSVGATLPFLAPYLRGLGFSGAAIGTVQLIGPLLSAPVALGWAAAADRLGAPARALSLAALWAAAATAFLPLAHAPAAVALVLGLQALAQPAVIPLADAVTLEQTRPPGPSYTRIRLFGSLGYILLAQGLGLLLTARGDRAGDAAVPLAIAACVAGYAWAARRLPETAAAGPRPALRETLALLRSPPLLALIAACALHWAACAPFHLLFGVFVRDAGLPSGVTGLAMTVGVGAEVLVLLAYPRLAARLSPRALFLAAFAGSALRWTLLSQARSAAAVVALQSLHGLTFGLFWGAAMSAMTALVPSRLRVTGQALFSAVVFGAGNGLGYQLAGIGYDRLGGVGPLFGWAARVELVPLVLAGLLARRWRR
ncbi:MFS transporter [Anaeromyxobacter paludicola]|uniref:MFS transporter n=1 Tax=Anaeromyxobacter paludicola TaxID=2918171 RepID=A0ABN6NAX0_9BACT|nr:MFS transporter [Anaeromyxobacter paludicola]BDG10359.1 MFS transporter [Anaeromyxobacter paludicola]